MKRLTLTFDNGPTAGVTDKILDVLSRHDVRSTFFMIGQKLADPSNAELVPAIKNAGHRIGNHTWSHSVPFGENLDQAFAIGEIERTQELIGDVAEPDKFFRPYGKLGKLGPHVFSNASLQHLKTHNYTTVTWTTVPGDMFHADWDRDFDTRFQSLAWSVVVLHDVHNACLAHLSDFIMRRREEGYEMRQDFPEETIVTRNGQFVTFNPALVADNPSASH